MKINNSSPNIKKDIFYSTLTTITIVIILFTVYYLFGNSKEIDTNLTFLFGAIIAFSGLMTKQYLLKENINYLEKWREAERLIDDITISCSNLEQDESDIIKKLAEKNNIAFTYMNYVVFEIRSIPVIPLLLVVLYGAAIIASESSTVSITCLILMLFLVSYLAQATITSNNLAIDRSELDSMIKELKDLSIIIEDTRN